MPRPLKIILWIIAVTAVLVVAFYQIENWRGRTALAAVYAEIEADGEPVTEDQLNVVPPPDDENFFKAPLVSSLVDYDAKYNKGQSSSAYVEPIYARPDERERMLAMRLPKTQSYGYYQPETGSKGFETKNKADFEAWAEIFRADPEYAITGAAVVSDSAVVLAAMNSRFKEEWEELNKAASRPHSFYHTEWGSTFDERISRPFPWCNDWLQMSKFLNLRISAAIEEGDFQTFREAVQIYIQFEKGIGNESVSISSLVLSSSHSMLLGTLWCGLESDSFSEHDLQWIAGKLREFDSGNVTLNSYRGERILFTQPGQEWIKRSATQAAHYSGGFFPVKPSMYKVATMVMTPDGWWDQNSAATLRFSHREIVNRWKTMNFSGAKDSDAKISPPNNPYTDIAFSVSASLVSINERFMHAYVMNQLAILACEIETYALKHGSYSKTLTELVPSQLKAIPLDPFDGKAMKYRKVDDRYVVYSIGLNETDDNGTITYRRPGRIDKRSGDWAWDYREVKKRDTSKQRKEFLEAIRTRDNQNEETKARLEKQKQLGKAVKELLKENGLPLK